MKTAAGNPIDQGGPFRVPMGGCSFRKSQKPNHNQGLKRVIRMDQKFPLASLPQLSGCEHQGGFDNISLQVDLLEFKYL